MMPLSGWDSCSEPCPPLWQLPKNTLLNSVFHGIDGKGLSHPYQSLFWETCKHHSFPVSPLGVELKPPNFLHWPCLQTLTLTQLTKKGNCTFCKFLIQNHKNRCFKGCGNATHVFVSKKEVMKFNKTSLLHLKEEYHMYLHPSYCWAT